MPVVAPPPELIEQIVCSRVRSGRWLFVGVNDDGTTWIQSKGLSGRDVARLTAELLQKCRRKHRANSAQTEWPWKEVT